MIKSLILDGFKAFPARTEVPVAPITLISGTNSSGKSSLLQSLLVLSQSLDSASKSPGFRLIGKKVQLGDFRDVVSQGGAGDAFTLGLEYTTADNRVRRIELRVVDSNGQALLERMSVADGSGDQFVVTLIAQKDPPIQELLEQSGYGNAYALREDVILFQGITATQHFMPVRGLSGRQKEQVGRSFDAHAHDALREVLRRIELSSEEERLRWEQLNNVLTESAPLTEIARPAAQFLEEIGSRAPRFANSVALIDQQGTFLESVLGKSRLIALRLIGNVFDDLVVDDLISGVVREVETMPRVHFEPNYESEVLAFLNHTTGESLGMLEYIGPLRESARLLYPSGDQLDASHIAPNGEGTVAVLQLNAKRASVVEAPPTVFETPSPEGSHSLERSVEAWARYLGIAEGIEVIPVEHYGLRLSVRSGRSTESIRADAPNVGAGLTQLLPILVAGCNARAGSLLVIEQPELHLHPAVQTRLAEFFVAITRAGAQVIVETHSEHLINGIRLAISKGEISAGMLSLLFCERYGESTDVSAVEVDAAGFIQRWPRGFFDESDKITSEIVSRSLHSGSKTDG